MLPLPRKTGLPVAFGLLALYTLALLSLDLTSDWRRLHEDNGAMHTTFALAHLHLGLGETRGHDVYYSPDTETAAPYGHHPPATALLLAAVFSITGSAAPAVTRLTIITFHLATLAMLIRLLCLVSTRAALYGGFVLATLPMSWYFGRMVNYEPLALCAITLQLSGWVETRRTGSRWGLILLAGGIVLGGLVDWPAFFFAAVIAGSSC